MAAGMSCAQPSGCWAAPGSIIIRLPPCSTKAGAPSLITSDSPLSIACDTGIILHKTSTYPKAHLAGCQDILCMCAAQYRRPSTLFIVKSGTSNG